MVNKDNGFQEVADVGFDFEFPQDPELKNLREKNRKKRLELLFGDPTLTVESGGGSVEVVGGKGEYFE